MEQSCQECSCHALCCQPAGETSEGTQPGARVQCSMTRVTCKETASLYNQAPCRIELIL